MPTLLLRSWLRATVRVVGAARLGVAVVLVVTALLLLLACDGDPDLAPEPLEETAGGELGEADDEAPTEAAPATDDPAEEADAGLAIEPGSPLGPGTVTTRVGTVTIVIELPEELEGGTVAPSGVPPSLELLVAGGAVVVFEALGHARDDGAGGYEVVRGLPDDLASWLTDELPGDLRTVEGPTELTDGVAVTLDSDEEADTPPVVVWQMEEGDAEVERFEAHGPPPQQRQHLWVRQLDDGWVGVVTYGPDVDRDLVGAIALSIAPG